MHPNIKKTWSIYAKFAMLLTVVTLSCEFSENGIFKDHTVRISCFYTVFKKYILVWKIETLEKLSNNAKRC